MEMSCQCLSSWCKYGLQQPAQDDCVHSAWVLCDPTWPSWGNTLEYRGCFDLTVLLETPGKPNAVVEIFFFPDNPITYEVTQQRWQNQAQIWTGWQCSCSRTALKALCESLELFRLICKLSHPACSKSHCAATSEIKSSVSCYSIELQRHPK